MLDDAIIPAANWILKLVDVKEDLEQIAGEEKRLPHFRRRGKAFIIPPERKHSKSVRVS